jgi:hypothetical protein
MTRAANASDFVLDIEGFGRFKFARRQQKDKYLIRSRYSQLTDDYYKEDGTVGDMEAWMHATIAVLVVEEPSGFSVENLDPLMDDTVEEKLMKIFKALRDKELSFRPKPAPDSPTSS